MAQQFINLGATPNDGSGEGLRDGGIKINENFSELYAIFATLTNYVNRTTTNYMVNGSVLDFQSGSTLRTFSRPLFYDGISDGINSYTLPTEDGKLALDSDIIDLANTKLDDIDPGTGVVINKDNPLVPIISAIPQSTAGIFRLIYFTGDVETTALGNFYLATPLDDGTESSVTQSVAVNDGQTAWYGQDLLGPVAVEDALVQAGDYAGELSIQLDGASGSRFDFTIEIYVANESGDVIDSGITAEPVGDLGVRPLAVLKTGATDLPSNDEVNRTFTGSVKEAYTQSAGTRGRYHIACTKVDGAGGIENVDIFFGTDHSGFISVPVALNTDNVLNNSTVDGATTTDALEALKSDLRDLVPYIGATADLDLGARGLTATNLTANGEVTFTNIQLDPENNVVLMNDDYYSGERVIDGNFSDDANQTWIVEPGFSFVDGFLRLTAVGNSAEAFSPMLDFSNNPQSICIVRVKVSNYVSGSIGVLIGGVSAMPISSDGEYILQVTGYNGTSLNISIQSFASGTTLDVDYVSANEYVAGNGILKKRALGSAAFREEGDFVENREIGSVPHVVTDYSTIEGDVVEADTQVSDGTQISISNKPTSDYPFISALGEPEFNTGDFPSSDIATATIVSGQSFVTSRPIAISALKFYSSVVTDNSVFTAYLRIYTTTPEDEDVQIYTFSGLPLVAGTPFELSVSPKLVLAGQTVDVALITTENATTTDLDIDYVWSGNTTAKPVEGEVNANAQNSTLRMSYFSRNSDDVSSTVSQLTVGSEVKIQKGSNFLLYSITNVQAPLANRQDFNTVLIGSLGTLTAGDNVVATCQVPISLSATYDFEPTYWAANPVDWASSTEGLLLFDGVAQTGVSDNAYGADIKAREVTKSDDWDIILLPTVVATVPTATKTSELENDGSDGDSEYIASRQVNRDTTVSGSYAVNWDYLVSEFTLIEATTFVDTNIPIYPRTITLHIRGEFAFDVPANWSIAGLTDYDGTAWNILTLDYYNNGTLNIIRGTLQPIIE